MKIKVLGFVSLMAVCGAASAQSPLDLGVSAGIYMPTSGAVRDAFGSSVFRFGLGSVGSQRTGNVKIGTELNFITANKNGNRLLMVPFTVAAEQQLTMDRNATTRPYVKAFAGLAYIDYGINNFGGRQTDRGIRPTFGVEGGLVVSDRLRLSARYNQMTRIGGFDFSGVTLAATFSLSR